MNRINVTLDDEHAAFAKRSHVEEGTLARLLPSNALGDTDPDPAHIAALLDGIPGARGRTDHAREQARRGETIRLDQL